MFTRMGSPPYTGLSVLRPFDGSQASTKSHAKPGRTIPGHRLLITVDNGQGAFFLGSNT